jgi:hypothetical protein
MILKKLSICASFIYDIFAEFLGLAKLSEAALLWIIRTSLHGFEMTPLKLVAKAM